MPAPPPARILIVDDEPAVMKSLRDTLRDHGYETVGCLSGAAALEALRATQFDLLLTDLLMPGMDGIELLQAAQKSDSNLVSVLMTGAGSIASAVKAMKAGALDYITKPLELGVILAVLSRSLDVRRLRMENAELARHVAERTTELEAANRALRTSEEQLRTLGNRTVQAQEAERGHVANELRVNITQLLYIILGRCQVLAEKLQAADSSACVDTTKINEMVSRTAEEVERIWRSLWSHELEKLGLVPALEKANAELIERTGLSVQMDCAPLDERLPPSTELTLYRIFQEALSNVEKHACARQVTIHLSQQDAFIHLTISDDGIGFDPDQPAIRTASEGFGLLRMRERATSAHGALSVKSAPRAGTKIEVRIPVTPSPV